ncbi:MAG TPA: transglycosylase SLT domain-containing protein [Burkholderiaceae bacterium]|nr:transglycosylase SLT domain-containing protein [Burkholderiaceae bacterium]
MQRFYKLSPVLLSALAALSSGCASLDPVATSSADPRGDTQQAARGTATPAAPAATAPLATSRDTGPTARAPAGDVLTTRDQPAAPKVSAVRPPAVAMASPGSPAASGTPLAIPSATPGEAPAVLPIDRDLWMRIRAGFAMPQLPTPLVAEKEHFYLSKPEYLQRMFQRGSRYLYYIVEELEKRGMPTELALLPFVESAMNPVALSSAHAAGLWQFIPSTGKQYDLRQDWWVDNRRDVVKSTQAALDYLQKIYAMHGNDWFLALASYNWGEGSVARAVKKNQAMGRPGDYLSLNMPAETRHYVPKLIALKNILLNAETLGLRLPDLPNRPYFVTIEKTRPIDLQLAAQFARMSVEDFVALNPAHNRPVISAKRNNEIKLPADRLDHFKAAMARHEADSKAFATWQPYTLKSGETLDTVASRTGVQLGELRKANGLRDGARIVAGTQLLAPQKGIVDEQRVESFVAPRVYEQIDKPAQYHTVGKRESLASIASRYRISAATLAAWNGMRKSVARGMRLLVQPSSTQTLLTNESGERSVVGHSSNPPVVVAEAPVAAPSEPAQPSRDDTPRMIKVSTSAARTAPVAAAAPHSAPVASRAAAPARQLAARRGALRQTVARATPAAARAPATVAARASSRKVALTPQRAERREVSRPAVKVAGDRRGRKA